MSARAALFHDTPHLGVFVVSGGGVSLLDELLSTAGASRSVLDARIPYASSALSELLGAEPEQSCSADTARAMAMAAFERARRLSQAPNLFGFACTASLATDRPKRGEHRAYVAIQTATHTLCAKLELAKGASDRAGEEALLNAFCWQQLALALEVDDLGERPIASGLAERPVPAESAWQALILGERDHHQHRIGGEEHDGKLLLSGSFNPLHEGHRQILRMAEVHTGLAGAYELSIENVDKPLLDYHEIRQRLAQFDQPVWLTRLPTFIEKARRFPGAAFAVGVDTIVRIAEPRYYAIRDRRGDEVGNATANRDEALSELAALNTRFIVFGRQGAHGFETLSDLTLPPTLAAICEEIGEARFRRDISSSELRAANPDD